MTRQENMSIATDQPNRNTIMYTFFILMIVLLVSTVIVWVWTHYCYCCNSRYRLFNSSDQRTATVSPTSPTDGVEQKVNITATETSFEQDKDVEIEIIDSNKPPTVVCYSTSRENDDSTIGGHGPEEIFHCSQSGLDSLSISPFRSPYQRHKKETLYPRQKPYNINDDEDCDDGTKTDTSFRGHDDIESHIVKVPETFVFKQKVNTTSNIFKDIDLESVSPCSVAHDIMSMSDVDSNTMIELEQGRILSLSAFRQYKNFKLSSEKNSI